MAERIDELQRQPSRSNFLRFLVVFIGMLPTVTASASGACRK